MRREDYRSRRPQIHAEPIRRRAGRALVRCDRRHVRRRPGHRSAPRARDVRGGGRADRCRAGVGAWSAGGQIASGRGEAAMTEPRWYVVQTQPHAENRALQHLERQGYRTYLPRYLKRRRHARRVETVAAPLFPRYLFVAVDLASQRWRSIQSTVGVARLVCNGEAPAMVAGDVVAGLKRRENADGFV